MNFFNLYSYLLVSLFIILVAAFLLLRNGFETGKFALLVGLLTGLVVIWFVVRPAPGTDSTGTQIRQQIGAGIPVLLEIQSPY
jgi:multisubunit Na+/H+ antiporter MnhE subunit